MDFAGLGHHESLRPHIASMLRSSDSKPYQVLLASSPAVRPVESMESHNFLSEKAKGHLAVVDKDQHEIYDQAPKYTATFGGSPEKPKTAVRVGLRANFTKILPHVTSAVVTAAVVQFSFRNHYFMDLMDPTLQILPGITQTGVLNTLQLAAKIHELILVASLTTIVMHAAQSYLLGNEGLPLGLITNSFAIGSGDFVRTKAFWSSIRTRKAHYWRFALLSLLATILATLAGPSSAISIIPSLGWFSIELPFNSEVFPLFVFNHSTVLWPTDVTTASLNSPLGSLNGPDSPPPEEDCLTEATSDITYCPAAGFRELYSWAGNLLFVNSSTGTNVSFPDSRQDSRRVLATRSCPSSFHGRASGMSLNAFVTAALTAFWTFARNNFDGLAIQTSQPRMTLNQPIFAPKVEVLCNGYEFSSEDEVERRDSVNFPSFTPARVLPEENFRLPYTGNMSQSTFEWVQMPVSPDGPAIGAAVRVPYAYRESVDSELIKQGTEMYACSLYASWMPVSVYYEPRQDDEITYAVQGRLGDSCLRVPEQPSHGPSPRNITIDLGFANAVNQNITFVTGYKHVLTAMLDSVTFLSDGPSDGPVYAVRAPLPASATGDGFINITTELVIQSRATMISTMIAGVMTDGLARVAGSGLSPHAEPVFLTNEDDKSGNAIGTYLVSSALGGLNDTLNATRAEAENWLQLDPVFERYGYGYQWQGSSTTQFGIFILLVNFALAVAHTCYILYKTWVRKEGMVTSWSTVAEIICLAMNSTPTYRLQDTCAGVKESKTWRQLVAIRETSPGHLEMVVGPEDNGMFRLVETNKEYGHLRIRGVE